MKEEKPMNPLTAIPIDKPLNEGFNLNHERSSLSFPKFTIINLGGLAQFQWEINNNTLLADIFFHPQYPLSLKEVVQMMYAITNIENVSRVRMGEDPYENISEYLNWTNVIHRSQWDIFDDFMTRLCTYINSVLFSAIGEFCDGVKFHEWVDNPMFVAVFRYEPLGPGINTVSNQVIQGIPLEIYRE